jgi:hypothetical protein
VLLLGALVGTYGLSSTERALEEQQDRGYTTYSYATGYTTHKAARKPLPAPSEWCWALLKNVSLTDVFPMDLNAELGPLHMRAIVGLREAVERIAA